MYKATSVTGKDFSDISVLSLEDNAACSMGFGVVAENDSEGKTK
jgi:hypothetical protein